MSISVTDGPYRPTIRWPAAFLILLCGLGGLRPLVGNGQETRGGSAEVEMQAAGQQERVPEPAAAPANRIKIPLSRRTPGEDIRISNQNGLLSLVVRDALLKDVLAEIAATQQLNIVCGNGVDQMISLTLDQVRLEDALTAVVSVAGYTWTRIDRIIYVTSIDNTQGVSPETQGRKVEVFHLDYAAATDLEASVRSMLSPVGKVFSIKTDPLDNRKTTEAMVVEDMPGYLTRIRDFISQMDLPPRQVLIEAHVLEIELKNDSRRGVNFQHAMSFAGHSLRFQATGFANPTAPSAFFATLDAGNLSGLIECLTVTNDAKTLASPRVLVLNGQTAKILIGEKIGFQTTTTTQTSTQQNVSFLNVGVVFQCTPRITPDNRVLMKVKPEVSTGQINPETSLPQTKSTEVETDIMVDDGQGIVIGGLIQEKDSNQQTKLAYLSDIKYLGKLFQRRTLLKQRSEVVIAILPRIVPYDPAYEQQAGHDAMRAQTPLLNGPLRTHPRPWEERLADCETNPHCFRLPAFLRLHHHNKCACQECLDSGPGQFGPQTAPAFPPPAYREPLDGEPNPGDSPPVPPDVAAASYGKPIRLMLSRDKTGVGGDAAVPPPQSSLPTAAMSRLPPTVRR